MSTRRQLKRHLDREQKKAKNERRRAEIVALGDGIPNAKWNGEPVFARHVRVIVGPAGKPTYWHAGLEGTERRAIEVWYGDQDPFYLDNEDDSGFEKVTYGCGSPTWGHKSLPVERVLEGSVEHAPTPE